MDKRMADELIALIDSKIADLEQSKIEILDLVGKDHGQIDLPIGTVKGKIPTNGRSETTNKVYETVLSIGKSASPKEIIAHLKSSGIDIPDTRVRQILMRWKGRLFKSPRRGVWRAIKFEN